MPTIKLTQPAVGNVKPPRQGRVEYWDNQLPGFGLRVSGSGRKTWIAMYRVKGKLVRETIGTISDIPKVSEARDRARDSLQIAQKGVNPVDAKRHIRREAIERAGETVGDVLDRYLEQHARVRMGSSSYAEVKRSLNVDVKAKIGAMPISELTRRHVRELLDEIVARGRAPHAHHVLAYLRPALAWAAERDIVAANVAADVPDPDPRKREDRTRDRYLDDDEIRLFWSGCGEIGDPFGPLFKLLLLTGQRRDELADATWAEFDVDKALWTLPGNRTKNGRAHLVHLAPIALEILETLPTFGTKGYLFTTTGRTPVSGFGRAQERLIAVMQIKAPTLERFTIHDLRRSTATGMASIGVGHHVLDKVLNHSSGKISGVGAIYNRFEYLDERKAALDAWSRHIMKLIEPASQNVVSLVGRSRA
jgi:integrase